MWQEFHQRNKHLGCSPFKIHSVVLKIDNGGTQKNGSKDKEIVDHVKGLISKR